jgi:hypothetical protein
LKNSAIVVAGISIGRVGLSAKNYRSIYGVNDRVRERRLSFINCYIKSLGKTF